MWRMLYNPRIESAWNRGVLSIVAPRGLIIQMTYMIPGEWNPKEDSGFDCLTAVANSHPNSAMQLRECG